MMWIQRVRESPPRWLRVLQSPDAFATPVQRAFTIALLLAWLAGIVLQSTHHEIWRDEMRALSIAQAGPNVFSLTDNLVNEGHPLLWYVMLRVGVLVVPSPVVLKVLAIGVAFLAVVVLFRFAPFPLWQKVLIACGGLPAYEYSVMARNYGISMLAFFGFAALYPHRLKHPFWTAGVLALLAQTNIHSAMLAGLLAAVWFVDDVVWVFRETDRPVLARRLVPLAIVLISIGIALGVSRPDPDAIAIRDQNLAWHSVVEGSVHVILNPTQSFRDVLPHTTRLVRDSLFLFLFIGLLARPPLAAALVFGTFALGAVFTIIYPGYLRHQGLLILFMITLYWLCLQGHPDRNASAWTTRATRWAVALALPLLLAFQIPLAWKAVPQDWAQEKSSSLALATLLNGDTRMQDAIVMGEPDYLLESLPYYSDHRIYIPRESTFRDYTSFTTENQEVYTLEELLDVATRVRRDEGRPVVIAIGHEEMLSKPPPYEILFPYQRVFRWSAASLSEFLSATEKVGAFHASQWDENYDVYLLR